MSSPPLSLACHSPHLKDSPSAPSRGRSLSLVRTPFAHPIPLFSEVRLLPATSRSATLLWSPSMQPERAGCARESSSCSLRRLVDAYVGLPHGTRSRHDRHCWAQRSYRDFMLLRPLGSFCSCHSRFLVVTALATLFPPLSLEAYAAHCSCLVYPQQCLCAFCSLLRASARPLCSPLQACSNFSDFATKLSNSQIDCSRRPLRSAPLAR